MMRRTNRRSGYVPGDHLVVCDRTGKTVLASETKREWNGLRVHKDHFETRHPQHYVRGVVDKIAVEDGRPWSTPIAPISRSLSDVEAASGAVADGVYTSSALSETRPLELWRMDLLDTYDVTQVILSSMAFSAQPPREIAEGVFLETQTYDQDPYSGPWSRQHVPVSEFGALTTIPTDTHHNVEARCRRLRLVVVGKGTQPFSGTLTHGSISINFTQVNRTREWMGDQPLDRDARFSSSILWL